MSFTLYNVINKPTDNIQHITVYSDTEWSPMVVYLFICLFVLAHAEINWNFINPNQAFILKIRNETWSWRVLMNLLRRIGTLFLNHRPLQVKSGHVKEVVPSLRWQINLSSGPDELEKCRLGWAPSRLLNALYLKRSQQHICSGWVTLHMTPIIIYNLPVSFLSVCVPPSGPN